MLVSSTLAAFIVRFVAAALSSFVTAAALVPPLVVRLLSAAALSPFVIWFLATALSTALVVRLLGGRVARLLCGLGLGRGFWFRYRRGFWRSLACIGPEDKEDQYQQTYAGDDEETVGRIGKVHLLVIPGKSTNIGN